MEQGIALGSFAPRRLESHLSNFLVITQVIRSARCARDVRGVYEEVYDVERQTIEGVKETEVKKHLKKNFGVYLSLNTSASGLNTSGFKSYYSKLY